MTFTVEAYEERGFLNRFIPSILVTALMLSALYAFVFQYGSGTEMDRANTKLNSLLSVSFYLTFYILFSFTWICLQIVCLSTSICKNSIFLLCALVCYLFAMYSIPSEFLIKLCVSLAILLTSGLRVDSPFNGFLSFIIYLLLIHSPLDPAYFGESLIRLPESSSLPAPESLLENGLSGSVTAAFAVILFITGSLSVAVRAFAKSSGHNKEIKRHLNRSISHISKINAELQDSARKAGEEAASIERNRISRDIHDISGYIFTNIISLMDAGISKGRQSQEKIETIFQTARTQAKDGLQETRRALHALRDSGYTGPKGIHAIYRIKQVFQSVTGVDIEIDAGNIPNHFTDDIDRMMYCTVQEALTNSRRHGRATRIGISFWLNNNILEITVTDNGIGAGNIVKGIGFAGMEERIAPFGGTLETSSPADGGFRLSIRLPIPEQSQGDTHNGNT